ncbi:restriction endonuclease subunit S [Komagataeibacter oboediens]|uniref:restriction endonuclease subunit S n=1 Tax=Komagataeibacter oboediens TaxID=65958 RepID=UPI001F479C28|nr:restriction endonuclease subunit S [Komagataeibacter oboediens]
MIDTSCFPRHPYRMDGSADGMQQARGGGFAGHMHASCWPTAPLGALVDCLDAGRVPLNRAQRARCPGAVPYHGASGVAGYVDRALFDGPLVLLGEDSAPFFDSVRDVAFFHDGPIWAGNHVHVLRPRIGVDGRFLAHALNTLSYAAYVDGTTRPKLTRARMNSLPVPCPPLQNQRAIAQALDHHLDRIDRQLRELDVQAMTASEYTQAAIHHALLLSGAAWPGPVPAGGTIRPLGSVFDIVGGGTPATGNAACWGHDVAWLTPADLPAGPPAWVDHGARSLSAMGLAACRAAVVEAGALVVSTRAPVGRVGMTAAPVSVSQGCKALVPRAADVDLRFLALLLHVAAPELRRRAGGSVFPEVDTRTLASLELCLPPLRRQRAVAQEVWEMLDRQARRAYARERLRAVLCEYRPALRQAHVNGQAT